MFGETKDIQICFRTNDGPCGKEEAAAVTNCGQYFVYYLKFEDPCYGYCGENWENSTRHIAHTHYNCNSTSIKSYK